MKAKNQKGFGLVLVIVVMAVLFILCAAILSISLAESNLTALQDKSMQSYYLAKSGVDTVSAYILKYGENAQSIIDAPESLENNHFTNGTFTVDVLDSTTDASLASNEIRVKGTGTVGDVQNTSSVVMKSLSVPEMLDKAIYTTDNLDITGMKVNGDIASAGTIQYSTNGSHQYNDEATPNTPRRIAFVAPFPTPGVSDLTIKNTTTNLTASASFRNIDIGQKGTLNLIPSASNIELTVDNLTIENNLSIDNRYGGSVIIYVNSSMVVTTQGLINNTEAKNLFIYLKSGSTFIIQADMILYGYIIGPDAVVEIQSSNSTINGAIFSKFICKNDTGSPPNGTVNYVPLPASGTPVGSLIPTQYKIIRRED